MATVADPAPGHTTGGLLFDGVATPEGGRLRPDTGWPGLGPELRWADAEPYRVYGSPQVRRAGRRGVRSR